MNANSLPVNFQAGTKGVIHAPAVNGQDNNGGTLCRPGGQRPGTILFEVEGSVTCKSCLKAIDRVYAESESENFTRTKSAKVEAQRDAGTLAAGLAAARARSEARAEADAANDPLVTLLGADTRTGMAYGAAIRPKARVTAHVTDSAEPPTAAGGTVAMVTAQATPGLRRVAGRLLAASKCGQRRPRRGRR